MDNIDCRILKNLDISKLKSFAKPSSFGKSKETVYDETEGQ